MLLRTSLTSPFGRKTRMAALKLGLMDRIEVVHADTLDPADPIRTLNPLGKIPVLILESGQVIFDSRVILEYFDHMGGGGRIIPRDFEARIKCMTLQALADGIMDAAILVVYESRYRPGMPPHEPWLDYQRGKIERALAALAANFLDFSPSDAKAFNAGTITAACALGYLDWRKQVDWRTLQPSLVPWFEEFRATHREFDNTAGPM